MYKLLDDEEDKYGDTIYTLRVTQGDSFGMLAKPIDDDGNAVNLDLIAAVKFKVYDKDTRECVFCKHFTKYDSERYMLKVEAWENTFDVSTRKYRYEIEFTLVDGGVNTTTNGPLIITEQALGGC